MMSLRLAPSYFAARDNKKIELMGVSRHHSLHIKFSQHYFLFIAGFAGDDAPRSVFPSLIGRARQPGIMVRLLFFYLLRANKICWTSILLSS